MSKKYIFFFLLAAVLLAVAVAPFASPGPDGLERVAAKNGFSNKETAARGLHSPLSGYLCPGIKNEKVATSIAGVIGTLVVFGIGYGLAALVGKRKAGRKDDGS